MRPAAMQQLYQQLETDFPSTVGKVVLPPEPCSSPRHEKPPAQAGYKPE